MRMLAHWAFVVQPRHAYPPFPVLAQVSPIALQLTLQAPQRALVRRSRQVPEQGDPRQVAAHPTSEPPGRAAARVP